LLNNLANHEKKIILIKKLVCELLKQPIENNKDIIFDKFGGSVEVGFSMFLVFSDSKFVNIIQNFIII